MSPARKKSAPLTYNLDQVKECAAKRWPRILSDIGGIDPDLLDGQHHPCPKCGGTDRFRMLTGDDKGAVICNQCFNQRNGDGFAALEWMTNLKFYEVLTRVAEYLGVQPTATPSSSKHSPKESSNPAEHLEFHDWNELSVAYWCLTKQPITPAAIQSIGGRLATYRKQYQVIALPVWRVIQNASGPQQETCGWIIYNATGGTLPKFNKHPTTGEITTEWLKIKLTAGSQPGLVGDLASIRSAATTTIWKVEGPSDLLALLSLELPADQAAFTNANGAGEKPAPWMLELLAGRTVHTIHDADKPGQDGAMFKVDHQGNQRPGWVPCLAERSTARNILLPYEIAETHGKDLRDWIREGGTVEQLQAMADATVPYQSPANAKKEIVEGADNYHRLARINLERYRSKCPNGTLRYWRNEWFKYDGFCYRKINETELKAKVGQSVKEEFDRLNAIDLEEWDGKGSPPKVRNVTQGLVSNVLFATAQMCTLSGSVELNTWIEVDDQRNRDRRRYIAMKNGILDVDGFMRGEEDCLKPHSPNWFSVVCLPYEFNPDAECPQWELFLHKTQAGDQQVINVLQEWAGYLLLPTTDYQKFLFFHGEGSNGKSVFLAAMEAMLGEENCSHISLEIFAQPFMLTQTLGKLANIVAECSEMDSMSEGYLKSFASGDRMTFNRKGLEPIEGSPTARLMISSNKELRFNDKSSGIYRRMLLVPWKVTIQDSEKILGMDKVGWWQRSDELPGIFNWALAGLYRLNVQRSFSYAKVINDAVSSYRKEMNPARLFFSENLMPSTESDFVRCSILYNQYKEWCLENGYRPLNNVHFGTEIARQFPNSKRERVQHELSRYYVYVGIRYGNAEDEKKESENSTHEISQQRAY